jgi:hypothetical protein
MIYGTLRGNFFPGEVVRVLKCWLFGSRQKSFSENKALTRLREPHFPLVEAPE